MVSRLGFTVTAIQTTAMTDCSLVSESIKSGQSAVYLIGMH